MPGFDFSNYNRNAALHARGVPLPKATSTGTTIVGCIFDGGVVVSNPIRFTPLSNDGNLQDSPGSPPPPLSSLPIASLSFCHSS